MKRTDRIGRWQNKKQHGKKIFVAAYRWYRRGKKVERLLFLTEIAHERTLARRKSRRPIQKTFDGWQSAKKNGWKRL